MTKFKDLSLGQQVIISIAKLYEMGYRAATPGLWNQLVQDYIEVRGGKPNKKSVAAYVYQLYGKTPTPGVIESFSGFLYSDGDKITINAEDYLDHALNLDCGVDEALA
jgi:hypothetical protein